MADRLLIVGASVRAAAQSALRAGLAPQAIDSFADFDLCQACAAVKVDHDPGDFVRLARKAPPGPWMYTGGLENHPDLIDQIAAQRPLLGNGGPALREVRDPQALAAALEAGPCRYPPWQATAAGLPGDGSWLRKPLHSAGGLHIAIWDERQQQAKPRRGCYFQQRVEGLACGATYVAAGGQALLLGVTEQLIGRQWTHASGFHYAGSLGPLTLTVRQQKALQELGARLSLAFRLVGLFGADVVLAENDFWLIEVNPRYTASVEVLERAAGISALSLHVQCCQRGGDALQGGCDLQAASVCGKAILYAPRRLAVSPQAVEQLEAANRGQNWPAVADLPRFGTVIQKGSPILTVFEEAHDRQTVEDRLQAAVRHWEQILYQSGSSGGSCRAGEL